MHFSIDRTVHTTAFDKPLIDHWLERKITLQQRWTVEQKSGRNKIFKIIFVNQPNDQIKYYLKI